MSDALPLYADANYTLCRESPELYGEFREAVDGRVTAGWELRVPERGPDGAPFQFILVGPTSEHRGAALRLWMEAVGGAMLPLDATVTVESYYKTGSERVTVFEGPYATFAALPDQRAPEASVPIQRRAEAGEDYVIRIAVSVPEGAPEPDPYADASAFELECVKLWWNETA